MCPHKKVGVLGLGLAALVGGCVGTGRWVYQHNKVAVWAPEWMLGLRLKKYSFVLSSSTIAMYFLYHFYLLL